MKSSPKVVCLADKFAFLFMESNSRCFIACSHAVFSDLVWVASLIGALVYSFVKAFFILCSITLNLEKSLGFLFNI